MGAPMAIPKSKYKIKIKLTSNLLDAYEWQINKFNLIETVIWLKYLYS